MIWYSLNNIFLSVINKWNYCLDNKTFTTYLVWSRWFIYCIQEPVYVLQYTSWKVFRQILLKYNLRACYTCWDILGITRTWDYNIMPRYIMHLFLTYSDRPSLIMRNSWWISLIPEISNVQILEEVKEHIFCFIKIHQLIIAHMFQVNFLNMVIIVNTMQHSLQECL